MDAGELAAQIEAYERLFSAGHYEEAARLAENLFWPLYQSGSDDIFLRVLTNTASTIGSATVSLLVTLGDILYKRDASDRARTFYLQALNLAPQASDEAAKILYSIGNTHFLEGSYFQAREYYEKSLDLGARLQLTACEAENLIQLSEIARGLGDFAQAEHLARRSLEINLREKRAQGITRSVQSLCNIALYQDAAGRHDTATEILKLCLRSVPDQPDGAALRFIRQTLAQLGLTDIHLNDKTD